MGTSIVSAEGKNPTLHWLMVDGSLRPDGFHLTEEVEDMMKAKKKDG